MSLLQCSCYKLHLAARPFTTILGGLGVQTNIRTFATSPKSKTKLHKPNNVSSDKTKPQPTKDKNTLPAITKNKPPISKKQKTNVTNKKEIKSSENKKIKKKEEGKKDTKSEITAAAKKRMIFLQTELERFNHSYYNVGRSLVTNEEYDFLFQELEKLEKEYPKLASSISPTKRVGAAVQSKEKHKFLQPVKSIAHTYDKHKLDHFLDSVRSSYFVFNPEKKAEYVTEVKYDGNACILQYKNGVLFKAVSRGDGEEGEDITKNVLKYTHDLPRSIAPFTIDGSQINDFEIRGELVMSKKKLEKINEARKESGERIFKNARNVVAGLLHLIDGKPVRKDLKDTKNNKEKEKEKEKDKEEGEKEKEKEKEREKEEEPLIDAKSIGDIEEGSLDFFAYNLVTETPYEDSTHFSHLSLMRSFGFTTDPNAKLCSTDGEVINFIDEWREKRKTYDWEMDGCVVKANSIGAQQVLGEVSRAPKWVIAYKYHPNEVHTKLLKVLLQTSRTGRVVPVAEFEPVTLSGATIGRATLNNFNYMFLQNLKIGGDILVYKGGEVIPNVKGTNPIEATKSKSISQAIRDHQVREKKFRKLCTSYLTGTRLHCPCNLKRPLKATLKNNTTEYTCTYDDCSPQKIGRLLHFCDRYNMDIARVGPTTAQELVKERLVNDVADLYSLKLKRDKLLKLEGWNQTRVDSLLKQIEYSKNKGLEYVIAGLGIPHIGREMAKIVASNFYSAENLLNYKGNEKTKMKITKGATQALVSAFSLSPQKTDDNNDDNYFVSYRNILLKLMAAGVKLTCKNKTKVRPPVKNTKEQMKAH